MTVIILETSKYFYQQLQLLVETDGSIHNKYFMLRSLFRRLTDQSVLDAPISVAGLFAKVDYILKQHNATSSHSRTVHDLRHSLNDLSKKSDAELQLSLPYDVKAMVLYVSIVFKDEPVPASLNRLLPTEYREAGWKKFNENCIRCIVTRWDDEFIYATEEQNDSELMVLYSKDNKFLTRDGRTDWSYLRTILSVGSSINLLRVRFEDAICLPELIIFEPDYLINITTITSCFEVYAESPLVHLINKFKPQANTHHIHLGNLSGRYLDDTVHHRNESYEESWNEFMQSNSIGVLACDEILTRKGYEDFRNDANHQKQNIDKLIGQDLHSLPNIEQFDPKDIVLEPTFFSELLGIQGRLDFLWETKEEDISKRKSIIIEQKSGKGEYVWPPNPNADPEVPEAKEQHWIQLILYRALFIYEFQKYADKLHNVMLLYSRYSKGLISKGHSPELMLRAIKMRNLLAWGEMHYSEEGVQLLDTLTSEYLRQKKVSDKLWIPYTKPQLDAVLDPIHNASPLEKAYFFRFARFVEREQLLSKVGNKEKEDSGFASKWLDSLEDKKAAGNIYDNLRIAEFGYADNGTSIHSIRLYFGGEHSVDTTNFRKGDIIILYKYKRGVVPNACAQMVTRASLLDITEDGIEVVLRFDQTDANVFEQNLDTLWAVEHDSIESSSSSLYSGLLSFLSASKERRDLLLNQRLPQVDESIKIKGEYGAFNTLVTRAKQARDLFLIIGPPGTGKTSYGLLNQLKEELLEPNSSVLLMSYTNRAVDEICSKLVEEGIDFIRVGSELSAHPAYSDYLLCNRVRSCKNGGEIMQLLKSARIYCATTAALNTNISLFKIKHFDLAIIDESSQILEPHLIGLLSAKHGEVNAISKFVFIGDHKQLPAVVQQSQKDSLVEDALLKDIHLTDCRLSLFERLLKTFKTNDGYDPRFVYMLTKQGRMHQDISEFPNKAFYGGKLDVVPLGHQLLPNVSVPSTNGIVNLLGRHRVVFVDSYKGNNAALRGDRVVPSLKTNEAEAEMIAATVLQIYNINKESFDINSTVGVIVPYRNQISTVRNAIDRLDRQHKLHDIMIDTVERYQGSQCDYIIYGFTVQQPYQLNFLTNNVFEEDGLVIDRKLNVAMTRARLNLVLIGNSRLLSLNSTFNSLLRFVKQKGAFVDVPTERYCSGNF